jgi:hypothetical protein
MAPRTLSATMEFSSITSVIILLVSSIPQLSPDHSLTVVIVNMPPDVWILVQELINSRKSDKEPYRKSAPDCQTPSIVVLTFSQDAIVAKWLTQQSGQPSIAPRDRQLDLLGQVTPGTGRWILSTSEFQRWKDSSSPDRFLFMPGTRKKPGHHHSWLG